MFVIKLIFLLTISSTVAFTTVYTENSSENNAIAIDRIDFSELDIESLIEQAGEEQKLIFASFYTTWCAPCQMMKLRTYRNRNAGEFFNEHFLSLQINGDKGEGIEIASRYGVKSFPTLVFLKPDGTLFYKTSGFHNAEELLEVAQEVIQIYSLIK
ncbi:MAG: thioredoxin family protein [Cyclonatronaceae bacterium]